MKMMSMAPNRHVLVPIATGTEEIEAVTIMDTLVRGGATVTCASVEDSITVTCSRGIKLTADMSIAEASHASYDLIALPGGMPGAERLRDNSVLKDMVLAAHEDDNKVVAAICAAPAVILKKWGVIDDNTPSTCYPAPAFKEALSTWQADAVVQSGQVVTSQGPGTAMAFSIKLIEVLFGRDKAIAVGEEMLLQPQQPKGNVE